MVGARVGLHHTDPARGLAPLTPLLVKGQLYFVTPLVVDLRILANTGGVHLRIHGPIKTRLGGLALRAKLDIGRDGRKCVGVGELLFSFGQLMASTGRESFCLASLVFDFDNQVSPVVAPSVMTGHFEGKARAQSRLRALTVKNVLTAPDLLSPDFGQFISLFRRLEMLPVEVDTPSPFCIHN